MFKYKEKQHVEGGKTHQHRIL